MSATEVYIRLLLMIGFVVLMLRRPGRKRNPPS